MLIRKMVACLVLWLVVTLPVRGQDVDAAPAAAAAAPAERPDIRIKKETGRDAANYPPDRLFDHEHMLLEMNIPDIAVKEFSARETLRSKGMGMSRAQMVLDARETITVKTITVNGQGTTFTHERNKLTIKMPAPVKPGETVTVVIDYDAKNPGKDGNGLNWLKGREAKPAAEGEEARPEIPPMIYSQGESCWNSMWFPCHDFPNDKLTTEIIVNVQEGLEVVSNGKLVSKEPAAAQEGQGPRVRWHWLQDKPHATYLVMIAIGKWDIVDVGGPETKRPGLSIPVYGKPGSAAALSKTFVRTPDMIAFFEEKFAQPYPWDKYAQVLVRNFRWGGMENTSATTLGDFAGGGGDEDGLIAHELAHQWFGDLVTCKSWAHLWLNEGWATYSEALWLEHHKDHKTYLKTIRDSFNGQRGGNRSSAPGVAAMVSNYYNDPDEPFTKADNPYGKGGAILHMLRVKIGDEAFFAATRAYLERYKFKSTDTDDFRKVMEEFSGQSLERFFTQWCTRPGLPRMAVEYTYDESAKTLTVKMDQTQRVDGDNPAYAFRVPLVLYSGANAEQEAETLTMETQTTSATATFAVAARPTRIVIDPDLHVLAQWKVTKKLDDPSEAPKDGEKKAEEAKPEPKTQDAK